MNNEEKVVSYYKETLEKKNRMDFQTPKHSVDCCICYFCCTCFFKQSFNQQRLQSNFTIGGNMFKRTIHPSFVYNHIRESSNEQRDDTQRSKTGRRIYPL